MKSYVDKFKNSDDPYYTTEDGCHYETASEMLAIDVLGLCSCSAEEASFEVIRDTLQHFSEWMEEGTYWKDLLKKVFQGNQGIAYLICGILDDKFIQHGTSIRGSWLTDDGIGLLNDLNDILIAETP